MADFDLAVIGAGAAGLSVTAVAAQLGLRVALIERGRMGGDCLNTGCVPSKALLAAAHARAGRAHRRPARRAVARAARSMGRRPGPCPRRDRRDRADGQRARFAAFGATVLRGTARFSAPDGLEVAARPPHRQAHVVAAGGQAAIPPMPGLDSVPYLTHETIFHLAPPEHLLILGGGPIGLEMAQAHAALGCRVTVIEAGASPGART